MPRFNIPAEDAQGPLVVGIDIGLRRHPCRGLRRLRP